jgi:hypothetical protein
LSAGKKILAINLLGGGDLPTVLNNFHAIFQAEENNYDTIKANYDQASSAIATISQEYSDKQSQVSTEFGILQSLEKELSNWESLSDYLSLLEFSKHPTGDLDENGNPIYDNLEF